jgi:hypothetical protein
MDFSKILKALRGGKKARRYGWADWLELAAAGGALVIRVHDTPRSFRRWVPDQDDILAEDWEIVT